VFVACPACPGRRPGLMIERMSQSAIFAPTMLSGRAALVTGGGTGLGKATALELVRCGAEVTIAGRREDVLAGAAEEIRELAGGDVAGGDVHVVCGDIREPDGAQAIVAAALEHVGRLDLLVNNAGGQFFSPAELIAAKGWRAVWRLNVDGMLNMAEAAHELAFGGGAGAGGAPAGVGAGVATGGTIVNVTLSPHHGMPGMAHSGAARATVEALTRELAQRWAGEGVSVTAVAAGMFATDVMIKYPEAVRNGMARSVPLQRTGEVSEHAWLVALLASPLGKAFSGSTVTLDGARDNWFGPWPPPGLADDDGAVPVEERKARPTGR
jgi:citronellol/citronellal dehydrogenase